jgi:hypothetical protein
LLESDLFMTKKREQEARPPKKALKPIETTSKKSTASPAINDEALEEFIHRGEKRQRHVPTAEPAPTHLASNPRSYGRPTLIEVE